MTLTMARRPFLTSLTAISLEFMPAGSKGKLYRKPDWEAREGRGGKGEGGREEVGR